jgi:hypothetical protein
MDSLRFSGSIPNRSTGVDTVSGQMETRVQARRRMALAAENFTLSAKEGEWVSDDATAIYEAGHAVSFCHPPKLL